MVTPRRLWGGETHLGTNGGKEGKEAANELLKGLAKGGTKERSRQQIPKLMKRRKQ